jgi:hypothetical protein
VRQGQPWDVLLALVQKLPWMAIAGMKMIGMALSFWR